MWSYGRTILLSPDHIIFSGAAPPFLVLCIAKLYLVPVLLSVSEELLYASRGYEHLHCIWCYKNVL